MTRIELRAWRTSDAAALVRAAALSPDLGTQFDGAPPRTEVEATTFLLAHLASSGATRNWAIAVDDVAVGNVGLSHLDARHGTAWARYWLAAEHRGRGLAGRALATAAEWAFDGGLHRIELGHRVNNPASCAVALRAGFRAEGIEREKLRYGDERFDVELHARLATDPAPDVEPLPFAAPSWDDRVADVWAGADEAQPAELRAAMAALAAERDAGDADALFERASAEDFLGAEDAAIPLYRAAIAAGLAQPRRTQAHIQLSSSLRNLGDASGALAALQGIDADDPLADAAQAFLALALHDDDKPTPALRAAVTALAGPLPRYGRALATYAGALVPRERVRAIVVGLLVRDGLVLAEEYPANARHGGFLRAPGGGIDAGERADDAIRREFAEELGVALDESRLLAVTENIFELGQRRGHEIVFVYAIRSADLEALPPGERLPVLDSDTTVGWYSLDALRAGGLPLYPDGAIDLVDALDAASPS